MPGTQVQPVWVPARQRPQLFIDGTTPSGPPRSASYGEQASQIYLPFKQALVEEGSYFTAINPIIGTGVAHALVTSFTNTAAMFSIFNSAPIGGPNVHLDFIRLVETATAPATGTSNDYVIQLDQSLSRAPTANNVTITQQNMNQGSATKSFAKIQAFNAGSLTVPAAGSQTITSHRIHNPKGIVVAQDEDVIVFGSTDMPGGQGGNTAVRATDPKRSVVHAAPACCAPQTWLTFFRWGIAEATNTPSYEYEIGFFER